MTQWRPSEGLRRAEPLTQQILSSAAAIGQHITDPSLRHRIVQLLADELDRALADGQGMGALPIRDGIPHSDLMHMDMSNGLDMPDMGDPSEVRFTPTPEVPFVPIGKKRWRRGRPKGSRNKAKAAEATT